MIIIILSIMGLLISLCTRYLERSFEKDKNYKAFCDISLKVSCTRAFSSKHNKALGFRNSILGMLLYSVIIVLSILSLDKIILFISAISVVGSFFFAYFQYKIRTFCTICTSTYIINILILISVI